MENKRQTNKERMLEAFDTLFNKRDYAAAEKFWSPQYIQHSAHIGPGREGLDVNAGEIFRTSHSNFFYRLIRPIFLIGFPGNSPET